MQPVSETGEHASEDRARLPSHAAPEDRAHLQSRASTESKGRHPSHGAIEREGELKKINTELRRCAQTTKDVSQELLAIDLKVWELQREHMRLVRIHEEQRAGKVLLELDEQIRKEHKELSETRAQEQKLRQSIEDMKLLVQELQDKRGYMLRSLDLARSAEVEAAQEAKSLATEVTKTKASLQAAEEAQVAAKQVLEERVVMRDQSSSRLAALHSELERARSTTAHWREELRAARAEYRGWQRDKEAAAAYTAQAMGLLANGEEQ